MSEIRVSFSGFISFLFGIISTLVSVIFVLVLTRTLSTLEYGTWGLIIGIISYAIFLEAIISVWVLREVARNIQSAKTAVFSGTLFSIVSILIYFISSYFIAINTDADVDIVVFGLILIPGIFLNRILTAINSGWKPEVVSYSQLCFAVTQVIMALILVYFLGLGVYGVIISVAISYLVSVLIQIIYAKNRLLGHFKIKFLKKWLKNFWLPLYPSLANAILYFDIAIFSILTGSVNGLAFWTAALIISSMVTNTQLIFRPTYSKLLSGADPINYLSANFRHFLYFSIPFVSMLTIFSKPAMFLLNPEYAFAFPIVIILAFQVFLTMLNRYFQEILMGIEKVDMYEDSSTKDYLKSKLFLMPSLHLIKNGSYVITLFFIIFIFMDQSSLLELLIYWALLSALIQIPFIAYTFILIKKHLTLHFESHRIFKYFFTSIGIFGVTYYLIESHLVYESEVLVFLPSIIFYLFISLGGYFGITYVIDSKTRELVKSVIKVILK